ncbi:hypothetical protein VTN00DRAFT_6057 [Thermoascus crustaceus]|uniref:uncharacterized protein n=1 Tax=Thermoascus crustaceus TaxID=5088 RepID=UPI003744738B
MMNNSHTMPSNRQFFDMPSPMATDLPSLSEYYYIDSDPVCKDTTTSFCPWDLAMDENFVFDISPDQIGVDFENPTLDAYPSPAEEGRCMFSNRASCTSFLSDLEGEEAMASSLFSGSSLSPVLSNIERECFRTQTQGSDPAYLPSPICALPNTPEQVGMVSPNLPATSCLSPISEADPLPPPAVETSFPPPRHKTTQKVSRTSSSSEDPKDTVASKRKAAHNAVEKRYRTNLNAKFLALSNAVPSLRASKAGTSSANANSKCIKTNLKDGVQFQNKSEVLTRALAYIQELQEEKLLLQNELNVLKENLLPGGMWRSMRRSREA